MYEPKWPFLLMYGSHNMRHTSFPWVDGLSTAPGIWGVIGWVDLSPTMMDPAWCMCLFSRKRMELI